MNDAISSMYQDLNQIDDKDIIVHACEGGMYAYSNFQGGNLIIEFDIDEDKVLAKRKADGYIKRSWEIRHDQVAKEIVKHCNFKWIFNE